MSINIKSFVKRLGNDILNGTIAELKTRINPAESITNPKMSDGNYAPGDVDILNITLVNSDGAKAHDIMPYVSEIHIYENIVYPSMFCELFIVDSIRMYEQFPITTDQLVTMSLKTPGNEKPVEYIFAVNAMGEKQQLPNSKSVKYVLQLISPELKASFSTPITKTFKGTISELIRSILEDDLKTKKKIRVEESTGIIDKTIGPRLPFSMIHEHYLDADNRRDNNGVYVFFENSRGYNLVTYEKLLKDGHKLPWNKDHSKRFIYTTDRNSDASDVKFRNILAFTQSRFCAASDIVLSGALGSSADPYSFATGAGERVQHKETEDGASMPTSDSKGTQLVGTNFIRENEKNNINNMLIAVNSETRPNSNIARVLVKRNAFLNKLRQIEAQIYIYGDTSLAVGDVIECSFPSASSAENDPGQTRLDSGNYLITHLRHIIINSTRPQHAIACNLMKAGMLGN